MKKKTSGKFSTKALEDFHAIDKALNGNEQGYTKLFSSYRRSVYHVILKIVRNVDDAEDITVESFAKAFRSLHLFKKDFTFSTWLFRIASNSAIDFLRKKKLTTISMSAAYTDSDGQSIGIDIADSRPNPQEEFIEIQKKEMIQKFVSMMPSNYQRLLRLRYFQELSYEEISQKLNVPLGTIKAQLYRAHQLMHDIVSQKREYI